VLRIFYAPKSVFADVDRGAPWWEPWIWSSLLLALTTIIAAPIQLQVMRGNPQGMPEEQLQRTLEAMQAFPMKYMGAITAPIIAFIVVIILAGASYIIVSMVSDRGSFKKHFSLCFWSSVVMWTGALLSMLVVRMRGIEEIRTASDAIASFGPAAFFREANRFVYAFLSTLDLFALWFYALVVFGVMWVFRVSGRTAFLVVLPIWVLTLLMDMIRPR